LLLAAVWVFLLRDVLGRLPRAEAAQRPACFQPGNFSPVIFVPAAATITAFLLVFGLAGDGFWRGGYSPR